MSLTRALAAVETWARGCAEARAAALVRAGIPEPEAAKRADRRTATEIRRKVEEWRRDTPPEALNAAPCRQKRAGSAATPSGRPELPVERESGFPRRSGVRSAGPPEAA